MATAAASSRFSTVADLIDELGGVSPRRIVLHSAPGTATEQDVRERLARKARVCELVEGVLVEKAVGYRESLLGLALAQLLRPFVRQHHLGLASRESGLVRLAPGVVRGPDVAFVSWSRIPGGRVPQEPIPDLPPDLAVEVLSESNTPGEMSCKRRECFSAGTRQECQIDPDAHRRGLHLAHQVHALHRLANPQRRRHPAGFSLPLSQLFAELDQQA